MALLLPLVWEQWMLVGQDHDVVDDLMPPVQMLGDVPGYALDQFTRIGNSVSRALVRECANLRDHLDAFGVQPSRRSRTIGDAVFLIEGGLLKRRATWTLADMIRKPDRMLPATARLGEGVWQVAGFISAKHREMANLRQQYFHHGEG